MNNAASAICTASAVDEYTRYRDDYLRDGYVIIPGFYQGAAFEELVGELDRYVSEVVPTLPDSAAFFQEQGSPESLSQMQHMVDPYFAEFGIREPFVSLAEALMGEPVRVGRPEWFNKPPGTAHPTPPHQDNFYINLDPSPLTMWLALDPVDTENGCLKYLPGTHRDGLRPHTRTRVLGFSQGISDWSDEEAAAQVPACLQPGDLTVHHGDTIHSADCNTTTDRHRRAFALVYHTASAQRNEAAHVRHTATAREQHLGMGLDVD
ncbi:MAG: phytanoyl-CoA dioxygenase [Planctomycetaceae bacterium]|jgi:phytanoyl-CoA hydroxylase|nr:phytanoyl-CoA dioxygenase [Planctomycetaceae bacterium]MDP7277255.1 phytanoyl-CoA dioxygenase family protein [Planctomycetaceae bacterium]